MDKLNQPSRKLVSQADQAMIPRADVPRSRFIGTKTIKTAFDAGLIYPLFVDEIIPGDHMKYTVVPFVRMSTPVFPIMDNLRIDIHGYFVPNRLVWDDWEKFMGALQPSAFGGPFGGTAPDIYSVPQVTLVGTGAADQFVGTVWDYFGYPAITIVFEGEDEINALIPRGHNLIWNEWYRDQNLQASKVVNVDAGPDAMTDYGLYPRAKAHDIFTSSLPWPQKFAAPLMGMTGLAPVIGLGVAAAASVSPTDVAIKETPSATDPDGLRTYFDQYGSSGTQHFIEATVAGVPQVFADLNGAATGISIASFREALAVQSLFEQFARGGTRYTEMLKAVWNVTTPDFRLQRPEFLGGGSAKVQVEAVAYTAESAEVAAGVLGGAATAAGRISFSVASPEHGFVFIYMSVRSELSYQQGLHPMWKRLNPLDYPWPALSGIGEEAILQGHLFYTANPANDNIVFGYNERYQWYRTFVSTTTGLMRSDSASDLDRWHLAQDFGSAPLLNEAFIKEAPPMERVLLAGVLSAKQQFIGDFLIKRDATRAIPQYGVPSHLGRF